MYKNLIFDLGGVILNLDQPKCEASFVALGGEHVLKSISKYGGSGIFGKYETGKINTPTFLEGLRELLQTEVSDEQLKSAWSDIIVDIPIERLRFLELLSNKYNLFLLSNTSPLHMDELRQMVLNLTEKEFDSYFEKTYCSYEVGSAKPNPEIYKHVLNDAGIKADECIFIDDAEHNLEAARNLGISTIHIPSGTELLDIMNEIPEKSATFVSAIQTNSI